MSKLIIEETRQIKNILSHLKVLESMSRSMLSNTNTVESMRYVSFLPIADKFNELLEMSKPLMKSSIKFETYKVQEMKGKNIFWTHQKAILEHTLLNIKMLISCLECDLDFAEDEFENISNFINGKIRSTIFSKPEKEIEIQNAIESLLIGKGMNKGIDYDRESGKFEFSGKEYIPDFIIPTLKLCIEVKLLKESRKSRLIDEINADITAYSKHYERILFIIYDLGVIQNEPEFCRDIESCGDIKVLIIKH